MFSQTHLCDPPTDIPIFDLAHERQTPPHAVLVARCLSGGNIYISVFAVRPGGPQLRHGLGALIVVLPKEGGPRRVEKVRNGIR